MPDEQGAPRPAPVSKMPPILVDKTQRLIHAVEQELGRPMITYWNSANGAICSNDVIGLWGILQSIGRVDRLSFFKSDGGLGQASLRIMTCCASSWVSSPCWCRSNAPRRRPCWRSAPTRS